MVDRLKGKAVMQRLCAMFIGVFLFLLILSSISSAVVLAAPGEGDGGGGGPAVPLQLDWSYPAYGEENVSITPIIQCKYSHNVAQYNVIKRNVTLFSLTKLDGTAIDANVYAADSQLEFDKRQYIYIEPLEPLEYNTTYIVTAKKGIQAKNSMGTEEDQYFQFTTCERRLDFNASDVSSMVEVKENQREGTGEQEKPATVTSVSKKVTKTGDAQNNKVDSLDSAPSSTGNDGSQVGEYAITMGMLSPETVTCQAMGFLLILSVIIALIKTKRQN